MLPVETADGLNAGRLPLATNTVYRPKIAFKCRKARRGEEISWGNRLLLAKTASNDCAVSLSYHGTLVGIHKVSRIFKENLKKRLTITSDG